MLASDLDYVRRAVATTDVTGCDDVELKLVAAVLHKLRCRLDSMDAAVVSRSKELAFADAAGRRARSR